MGIWNLNMGSRFRNSMKKKTRVRKLAKMELNFELTNDFKAARGIHHVSHPSSRPPSQKSHQFLTHKIRIKGHSIMLNFSHKGQKQT